MKYIITESKLNQAIYDFIDKLFAAENGDTEIIKMPGIDMDGSEMNGTYDFVNNDYYDNEGEYLFGWTGKEYYDSLTTNQITQHEMETLSNKSPIVVIYDKNKINQLNNVFGDIWKPVFKQWFKDKSGLDYKTLFKDKIGLDYKTLEV
jgi:serine kinase of HPr protein (carbohydrate metabolism regulator)